MPEQSTAAGAGRPEISVVVPCFNQGRFLAECVASLEAQTSENWECIIVDDGSTDETQRIGEGLAREDSRVAYIRQANAGCAAARNRGLSCARGTYIQFLDADDVLVSHKFASQRAILAADRGLAVVYGDFVIFSGTDRASTRHPPPVYREKAMAGDVLRGLMTGNFIAVHSALVRREAVSRIGGFDENLAGCEDFDFWLRLAAAGCRFAWVPGVVAMYRENPAGTTRAALTMRASSLEVLLRLPGYSDSPDAEDRWLWRHAVGEGCRQLARELRVRGMSLRALSVGACGLLMPHGGRLSFIRTCAAMLARPGTAFGFRTGR